MAPTAKRMARNLRAPTTRAIIRARLQKKYDMICANEVRYEEYMTEDADYLFVAFGTCSRICKKAIGMAREEGIKVGLFRPITLFPFPTVQLKELGQKMKGILSVEMNADERQNECV